MKYKRPKQHHELPHRSNKQIFWWVLLGFVTLVCLATLLSAPAMKECKEGDKDSCVCPDSDHIGKKNILFVDATDAVPTVKREKDLESILERFVVHPADFFVWIGSGKKVDKTTIYVLNKESPSDMSPVGSFCQIPPSVGMLFSNLTGKEQRDMLDRLQKSVHKALDHVKDMPSAPTSTIVEALAVTTSNASSWKNGSTLIISSDLMQNSNECGFFDAATIPNFKNVSASCKRRVDVLRANLNKPETTVAICVNHTNNNKANLFSFWKDLFGPSNNAYPDFTCDPDEIIDRAARYGRSSNKNNKH